MVKGISEEELMEWIKKSCEEQGIPLLVSEPSAVIAIATILKSA